VLTRTRLRFHYKGADRTVDPWGVVFKHGRWYLVGFDHLRHERRCYRLDRVVGGVEPDGPEGAFDRPIDVDLVASVPDDPILMGDGEVRTARVRVDRRIAGLLPGDVVDDGGSEVEIELQLTYEPAFIVWVLGWGELAEVVGPPELRAAVVDRLRELAS
jgi:predicted DNA-binding transcriptional regulator YafY